MSQGLSAEHPFPGLRPFEFEDREFFFGRDEQIFALYRLLDRSRFTAVIGSSGSGKSSLVRAGLLPLLEEESKGQGGKTWRAATMRPGDAPIERLADALAGLAVRREGEDETAAEIRRARIERALRRSSFGLGEALDGIPGLRGCAPVIVVDQFEELFRYATPQTALDESRASNARWREEAATFVQLLLQLSLDRARDARVLITMRSDFIGECAQYQDLPEAVSASQFLVPGLTRDQREDAIVKPIAAAGASIEPVLVERLLNDVGTESDQLPVLQHCLRRLWERAGARAGSKARVLTQDDYRAVGGMGRALSQHADSVLASLPGLELAAEQVFRALGERDKEGRATRRALPFAQLLAETGVPEADLRKVLDRFRADDCSFLTPRVSAVRRLGPDSRVDVVHEALLRRWDKIAGPGQGTGTAQTDVGWLPSEEADGQLYRALLALAAVSAATGAVTLPLDQVESRWQWWNARPRTEAWAARYGNEIARVRNLFANSLAALEADRAAKVEALRREREGLEREAKLERERAQAAQSLVRRTRAAAVAMSLVALLALLALGGAAYGFFQARQANGRLNVALADVNAKQAALVAAKNAAEAESKEATRQTAIANGQRTRADAQKLLADRQRAAADAQRAQAQLEQAEAVREKGEALHEKAVADMRTEQMLAANKAVITGLKANRVLGVKGQALTLAYESSQRSPSGEDVALAALDASTLDGASIIRSSLLGPLKAYSGVRRAKMPEWLDGALADGGKLVVLVTPPKAGSDPRATAYVLDARLLTPHGKLPDFPAGAVCGFNDAPLVVATDGTNLSLYDVSSAEGRLAGTQAIAGITAMACLQGKDGVVVASGAGSLRTFSVSARGFAERGAAQHVPGPIRGLVPSSNGAVVATVPASGTAFSVIRLGDAAAPQQYPVASAANLLRCVQFSCAASVGLDAAATRVAWCDRTTANGVVKLEVAIAPFAGSKASSVRETIPACPGGSTFVVPGSGEPVVVTQTNVYLYDAKHGYQIPANFGATYGFYTGADDPPVAPSPPPAGSAEYAQWQQWKDSNPGGPANPLFDEGLEALITPEVDGVALRTLADISAPILGRQESPYFRGCIASWGHDLYMPGKTRPVQYDLDVYRTQYDRTSGDDLAKCLFDSGAGAAVELDYTTGGMQIWDIAKPGDPLIPHHATYARPVENKDAKGNVTWSDFPRAAYDPTTNVTTVLDHLGIHRYSPSGLTSTVPMSKLLAAAKIKESARYELSPRGRYMYFVYVSGAQVFFSVLAADGRAVGEFEVTDPTFSRDETLVLGRKRGENNLSLFKLPDMRRYAGVLLDGYGPGAISGRNDAIAYVDKDMRSIDLFDLKDLTFAGHLPGPPFDDRGPAPFIDLRFSGDGRYLMVQYRYDNGNNYWIDAIYSVDPNDWEEQLCQRVARPMTPQEVAAFHAPPGADPCRRFERDILQP